MCPGKKRLKKNGWGSEDDGGGKVTERRGWNYMAEVVQSGGAHARRKRQGIRGTVQGRCAALCTQYVREGTAEEQERATRVRRRCGGGNTVVAMGGLEQMADVRRSCGSLK